MKILLSILILLLPATGFCQSPLLDEANTLFSQAVDTEDKKKATLLLDKALMRYEQLYRDQPAGRLAYNIGNTYYQMNNKAMALVFYKRANKEIPADQNLTHNLELVREELQLENTSQNTTNWYPPFLKTNQLQIFIILYGLFWITTSIRYAKRTALPLAIPLTLLALTLASSTIIGMEQLEPPPQEGVITTPDTMARQGNGRNFEPSFNKPLNLGTEFQILEKRGYWLRIQLNQGQECWIPTRSCEVV